MRRLGALVDLDPRLSEALLSSLGSAGVAAYVEPATGEDVFSRAAQHPLRPLDRLWVDPVRADTARQVVTAEVADLTTLLAEDDPGATAHGFVQAVPRTAAARVLMPPALPDPPSRRSTAGRPAAGGSADPPPAQGAPATDPAPGASPPGAGSPGANSSGATPPGAAATGSAQAGPAGPADLPPGQSGASPRDPAQSGAGQGGPPAGTGGAPGGPSPSGRPDEGRGSSAADDEMFRQIVAGYSRGAEGPVPPWPVSEDLDPPRRLPPTRRPDRPQRHVRPESAQRPSRPEPAEPPPPEAKDSAPERREEAEDALPGWVEPAALEDDGHYVPPPPPPIPRLAPKKVAAALTLLVGFLLMFVPGLLLQPRTVGVAIFGVLLTLAGAGALVYLMRDPPPDETDPDDGAVV